MRKDSVSECGTGANLSQIWSRGVPRKALENTALTTFLAPDVQDAHACASKVSPDMYIIDHNSLAPSDFREEQMLRRITSQSQG